MLFMLMQSADTTVNRPPDKTRPHADAACQPFKVPQNVLSNITSVWANDGGDKVTQDELRGTNCVENLTGSVLNRTWNGNTVTLKGARNEIVSFNLVLEAGAASATNVSVSFDTLTSPNSKIQSTSATGNDVFSWTGRPIELFYVRYLQIKGLSTFGYNARIEQQVPVRFHADSGRWIDRPDHDKFYPDILVPLELTSSFTIAQGTNQSIWADVYIPKTAAPGMYAGTVTIKEGDNVTVSVPVQLEVYGFMLPDAPSAKSMAIYSPVALVQSWFNTPYVDDNSPEGKRLAIIRDRYNALAHRHKLALLTDAPLCAVGDYVCPEDVARLNGSAFSSAKGYDGPGRDTGQDVYSIGTYGTWNWRNGATEQTMRQHSDAWVNWFANNLPKVEYFLYLLDEPTQPADLAQVQTWADWIQNNPGPGRRLSSFSTVSAATAMAKIPALSIPCTFASFGDPAVLAPASEHYRSTPGKHFCSYNGTRPGVGSFVTEDEGVALRELPWVQYKMGVSRWLYWMVNGAGSFQNANTWGTITGQDDMIGAAGGSNGESVLFYPGTNVNDKSNPYNVDGPFASERLKSWRRGIQDVDYLTMAATADPEAVKTLVSQMVPKALWEVGVGDPKDPTWVVAGISWPTDPDAWESARAQLATIIQNAIPARRGSRR
jgi:hypothetical protein